VSVSSLARQVGVNANQLSRWLRERGDRQRAITVAQEQRPAAFVPVTIQAQSAALQALPPPLSLHARMPNGAAIDISACDLPQTVQLIEALGRLPCSASTKG